MPSFMSLYQRGCAAVQSVLPNRTEFDTKQAEMMYDELCMLMPYVLCNSWN